MRRGLRGAGFYVGSIIVTGALFGCLLSPRRMLRAWRRAGAGHSLIGDPLDYDALLALDVAALRARLNVDRHGVCEGPRGLHANAPRA